jgi:hypothetical protein
LKLLPEILGGRRSLAGVSFESLSENLAEADPLGRLGEPREIAPPQLLHRRKRVAVAGERGSS